MKHYPGLLAGAVLLVLALLGNGPAAAVIDVESPVDDHPVAEHRRAEAERKSAAFARWQDELRDKIASPSQQRYDVTYLDLDLSFDPSLLRIDGIVGVTATVLDGPLVKAEFDLDDPFIVSVVRCGGVVTTFSHVAAKLVVNLDRPYDVAESFTVEIEYGGVPDESKGAFGFDQRAGQDLIWSLSEPFGARTWWPGKDAPSDKADSAAIAWTVPSNLIAVSNGTLEAVVPQGAFTRYEWFERYPIVPYLISIAAYAYTEQSFSWQPATGDPMPVTVWSWPDEATQAAGAANLTLSMLDVFEGLFGPYPFVEEKYGQAQFQWGGGMEHQTASSMCCWFSSGLIAHELAHQWYGDQVTCDSFTEIWVNEGFATYAEALWREASEGVSGYQNEMAGARYFGPGTIRVPANELDDFGRVFSSGLSYNKASWVLHMLRGVMGDADFFDFLKAFAADPQITYGTARTGDVRRVAEQVSGLDLQAFFDQWIDQEWFPTYAFGWQAADTGSGWDVTVTVEQLQSHTIYSMPVTLRVTTASGATDHVVTNDQPSATYVLPSAEEPLGVELDPDDWILHAVETKVADPSFHRGVLVVNGVHWASYGSEITSAYADSAFTGSYGFEFWDLFGTPSGGYIPELPAPIGQGAVPPEVLGEFSTVIWVGNNYNGDLGPWIDAAISSYLQTGGNLLLMSRMGQDFLPPVRSGYLGLRFAEDTYETVATARAAVPELVDMAPIASQSLVSVFETGFDQAESVLLFRETDSFGPDRGLGAWRRPSGGGSVRPSGGHFAHIAGRPYRWDRAALRANVHAILSELFGEPTEPVSIPPAGRIDAVRLLEPAPNPFNPRVTLAFELPQPGRVTLEVYDVRGRRVRTLLDEELESGEFARVWDGTDARGRAVASGVYTVRLRAGAATDHRQVTLVR